MKVMDLDTMKFQYLDFSNKLRSLMLSTIDEEGQPFVSYAPFVKHEGKLFIYISKIANHYRHLEMNPAVDAMMIEDEANTANLFARQRARFVCTARNLGNEDHEELFKLFDQRFNKNMMNMLRTLDFSLFELTPTKGRYVAGFGQAFDLDLTADTFVHVARDGHGQSSNNEDKEQQ